MGAAPEVAGSNSNNTGKKGIRREIFIVLIRLVWNVFIYILNTIILRYHLIWVHYIYTNLKIAVEPIPGTVRVNVTTVLYDKVNHELLAVVY